MQSTSADYHIRLLLETLLSPMGILAVVAAVVLLVVLSVSKTAKWGVISLLMWVSTLGYYDKLWVDNRLVFPLEQIRQYGRPIVFVLLVSLLLPMLASPRGWRTKLVFGGTIAYFVFELCFSTRLLLGGLVTRGIAGAIVYTLIFLVFGVGLGHWLQSIHDIRWLLRTFVLTALLFLLGSIYQLLLNASAIVWNTRFLGTTGNPQHAAVVIAILLPAICCLLILDRKLTLWRVMLSALAGFLLIFLLWTGSRTGMLMAVIGLSILFHRHIGKGLGIGIAMSLFALIAAQWFSQSVETINRFTSLEDTRSGSWANLLGDFGSSPLFGVIREDIHVGENSYLTTIARFGLVGLVPLVLAMGLCGAALLKLHKRRSLLGDSVLIGDLVMGGVVSLAAGACFEGFLLGTLTLPLFAIYIYLAILTFLLDAVDFNRHQGADGYA